ncbi:peptidoglycan-binding protein [Afipia sp. P52-10]|uniref:serine protease n=1 Tax=Afipia sp. P52-10 TaxID=1429916 RepID=UPI0003DF0E6F|nr:serine protease [Afipia sp. P52-10]ETR77661.1 peptidoglycan-binding protein [Afipia sp. P52-10]
MKSLALAPLLVAALCWQADAQTPAPKAPPAASSPPAKPAAPQTPIDTVKALPLAERIAIQSDLAWVSFYNGGITGDVSERMLTAIRAYQKDLGGKPTGLLTPQERAALATAAKKLQNDVGWTIAQDPINGIRLGIPTKLVPQMSAMADTTGSKWSSAQGQIQIETWRRRDSNLTIAAIADRERKEPAGRRVDYSVVRPDFFVLSGLQGLKKFYIRGQLRGSEVRGMTVLYDQATEGTMEPVVIAMSSAFTAFPTGTAQPDAPPPRRTVEYATGLVVSADGAIVTDRQVVDGCQSIVVPGHGNADRVAEDKTHDIALLRVYGARDLKPLAMAGTAAKPALMLTGIADPQSQGGGSAVSTVKTTLTSPTTLAPAPGLGFAGAAAVDAEGRFAGMVLLKPVVVAGTALTAPANEAALVSADQLRAFLAANTVTTPTADTKTDANTDAKTDAKASVLRIICVRK